MFVAKEKRKSNIAEYVLYMWHVEDVIRACRFDLDVIFEKIISGYNTEGAQLKEVTGWYESLVEMMRREGIEKSGHLQMVKNTIGLMEELHQILLKEPNQPEYMRAFFQAKPNIGIYKTKSNLITAPDIEVCLHALYSLLLLKMGKKEISTPTLESMETFSRLLAILSSKFVEWENGTLELKN